MDYLKDIRVLDLSQFLPGPFATQMLGDMGADVVKLEPPRGDPMRTLNPISNARGPSPFHALINAGKRVIALDLKTDDGRATFSALVRHADVLLESYRPGVMEKLGFGWQVLRELNGALVHCALSGYGQNGPLRLASGHDINYVAAAGQLGLTGDMNAPHAAFPMVADYAGALQATVAILGALVGRGRNGQGTYIDIAMTDAVLAWQSQTLAATSLGHAVMRDQNLLTGGAAFYRTYKCADDRFVSLGAIEEIFWANFCVAVARPDWIPRQHHPLPQDSLIRELEVLFASKTMSEWNDKLSAVDCCFQTVPTAEELVDFPQHQARQLISKTATPNHGELATVLFPAWVDGNAPRDRAMMQEVTADDVLSDWSKNKQIQ